LIGIGALSAVAVYVFLGYFVLMFTWAFFNLGRVGWGIG
jgi:hypothetical protein